MQQDGNLGQKEAQLEKQKKSELSNMGESSEQAKSEKHGE